MFAAKRLQKELAKIHDRCPPGIAFVSTANNNLMIWTMDISVLDANPIYTGQTFRLEFSFSNNYPIEPPEVVFVKDATHNVPMHPHIYSNGIICLDLLDKQAWSPVHNVESVCLSLQSMLTGNTVNERPPNDDEFVRSNYRRPRDIAFEFHDDQV